MKKNSLAFKRADLIKEWHPTKNGELTPYDFSYASNKKVWWICSNGHEWQASINNRNHLNRGCPYCSHNKVLIGKTDLETTYPDIAKEWNYRKNNGLLPSEVLSKSNKSVWWICFKGHEYRTKICNKTIKNYGCPYCSNEKVLSGFNDLETTHPDIAKEWDYSRNVNLKPSEFTSGSGKKVWWICSKGHSYYADIHNRVAGTNCPYCANQRLLKGYNDLETTNPYLSSEWDYERNRNLNPSDVIAGSHKKVWWICKNKHHYQASIVLRGKGTGCPICNKKNKTSFPEQAIYFYIKKEFPDAINGYKNIDIFGKRMELDIYIPSIKTGIEYDGKVFHDDKRIVNDDKKYSLCKNNNIKLVRISEKSDSYKRQCDKLIEVTPADMSDLNDAIKDLLVYLKKKSNPDIEKDRNSIIYELDKRKINLAEKYPEVAKEWNYKKNNPLVPQNVSPHSNLKVWWICSKGHEWNSRIGGRTSKNNGCPYCAKLKLPKYAKTCLEKDRPDVCKYWDYELNDELKPDMVGVKSAISIWLKCKDCGYSWSERVNNITKRKYICPKCKSK